MYKWERDFKKLIGKEIEMSSKDNRKNLKGLAYKCEDEGYFIFHNNPDYNGATPYEFKDPEYDMYRYSYWIGDFEDIDTSLGIDPIIKSTREIW